MLALLVTTLAGCLILDRIPFSDPPCYFSSPLLNKQRVTKTDYCSVVSSVVCRLVLLDEQRVSMC